MTDVGMIDRPVPPAPAPFRSVTGDSGHPNMPNADALEARLREIGATRYHNLHPFHAMLHGGELNKGQVQAWALNRYYYQSSIPRKDAGVMGQLTDINIRREWRHRIEEHDGTSELEGGIIRWYKLTDGLGLDRELVTSTRGHPSRHPILGGRIRPFRQGPHAVGSGGVLADRTFCPGNSPRAYCRNVGKLFLHHRRCDGLFSQAPEPSAPRRRLGS